jgi:eukaryotic translation initiation factor 2C
LLLVDESREKEFTVSIRRVAMLNSSAVVNFLQGKGSCPQEHLQALDIALREAPTHRFTPVGRSFFTKDFGSALLDGGLVAWNGFFQSLWPTAQGLVINVDLATTSFYESIALVEFLRKNLRQFDPRSRMSDATRSMVKKAIVRLKVSVIHRQTPRKYRICGLSPVATKDLRFTLDEGVEVGIMEYFWNTYNFRIMFPELPCVQVQAKKTSYLPMEVCVICEGQKYIGRLSERQTTSLRALACVRPGDREQNIRSLMARPDGPGRYSRLL